MQTKDGLVDYTLLVASLLPEEVYSQLPEEGISDVFRLFDVQGRGCISAGDLRSAVNAPYSVLRLVIHGRAGLVQS